MQTTTSTPETMRGLARSLACEAQAAAATGDDAAVRIARLARAIADQADAVSAAG